MTLDLEWLRKITSEHSYPLLFATVSGAHLYGFPSPDSDFDLRGAHVLPVQEVLGLDTGRETVEVSEVRNEREIDLVTHDTKKFFLLLLKRNGYVLEQLYSPLVVHTTPEHEELKEIARGCITRHHAHHYLGFAQNEWRLFEKETVQRIKPLLYVFRVLLTGINLMRTGEIEASLPVLNRKARLPYLDDLIARKLSGSESAALASTDRPYYERDYRKLLAELELARDESDLPDRPSSRPALNDLLVRVRLQYCAGT